MCRYRRCVSGGGDTAHLAAKCRPLSDRLPLLRKSAVFTPHTEQAFRPRASNEGKHPQQIPQPASVLALRAAQRPALAARAAATLHEALLRDKHGGHDDHEGSHQGAEGQRARVPHLQFHRAQRQRQCGGSQRLGCTVVSPAVTAVACSHPPSPSPPAPSPRCRPATPS